MWTEVLVELGHQNTYYCVLVLVCLGLLLIAQIRSKKSNTANVTLSNIVTDSSLIYEALDKQTEQIRLLHLFPARAHDAPLLCRLSVVSLKDTCSCGREHGKKPTPVYDTLSYVWGLSTEHQAIYVKTDDRYCELPITDNLGHALRRLRPKGGSPMVLWADAICINQHDMTERGHQVTAMGLVYEKARRVHIWLGEPTTLHKHPLKFYCKVLCDYYSRALLAIKVFDESRSHASKAFGNDFDRFCYAARVLLSCRLHKMEDALASTATQWHTRAWVYQEYLLSQQACLHFGGNEFAYSPSYNVRYFPHSSFGRHFPTKHFPMKLSRLSRLHLKSKFAISESRFPVRLWILLERTITAYRKALTALRKAREYFSIVQKHVRAPGKGQVEDSAFLDAIIAKHLRLDNVALLNHTIYRWKYHSFRSPRQLKEKGIEALMEVAISTRHMKASEPRDKVYSLLGVLPKNCLVPDYNQPVWEVYARATYATIIECGSLFHLRLCSQSSINILDLPSWALDFTSISENVEEAVDKRPAFNLKKRSMPTLSSDSRALGIQGCVFTRIQMVQQVRIPWVLDDEKTPELVQEIWNQYVAMPVDGLQPDSEPLHGTTKSQSMDSVDNLLSICIKDWYAAYWKGKEPFPSVPIPERHKWSRKGIRDERYYTKQLIRQLRRLVSHGQDSFSLIVTTNGCFGFAPSSSAVGDVIAYASLGMKTPFLLRRQADAWSFQGMAYIDNPYIVNQNDSAAVLSWVAAQKVEQLMIV